MLEGEGLGSWVWVTLDSGWLYRSRVLGPAFILAFGSWILSVLPDTSGHIARAR